MAGRIVVFGASGYTGRLTVAALVERGLRPVLAGRDAAKLAEVAAGLGGAFEIAVADALDQASVDASVEAGDVLVATVGPFVELGEAAARSAVAKRAHYLDSAGEPPFVRRMFSLHGPSAARAGIGMVPSFGYDWVPGNLAGALALREAGPDAVRVDTAHFLSGGTGSSDISGGTRASLAAAAAAPSFAYRDGALSEVGDAERWRSFEVAGRSRLAAAVGGSEHFALPRMHAGLREVNSFLGWFGPIARSLRRSSAPPDADAPAAAQPGALVRLDVVARAYDGTGARMSEVRLTGTDPYRFTAEMLAWGADRVARGALLGSGVLGPVEAFGLEALAAACSEAGLERFTSDGD